MTNCHHIIFILSAFLIVSACDSGRENQSLAYYSSVSESGRMHSFELYAAGLDTLPPAMALERQKERLADLDSAEFAMEMDLQEKFFDNPNSPYRCEEYMIPVLEKYLESPFAPQGRKMAARGRLPLYKLNRLGEKAGDFSFTLRNGRQRTLYSIDAEFTVLFFSNQGCDDCKRTTELISGEPHISTAVRQGRIAIVNIFPDSDIDAWMEFSKSYPEEWTSGFAPDVDEASTQETPLYNLRAIPSLYLLDSQKRVLLKDAPVEKILFHLFGNQSLTAEYPEYR